MIKENVSEVSIDSEGRLKLRLESGGSTEYQFIYREAEGVNWDNEESAFVSSPINEWSEKKWFEHLLKTAKKIGVDLQITPITNWVNISTEIRENVCDS